MCLYSCCRTQVPDSAACRHSRDNLYHSYRAIVPSIQLAIHLQVCMHEGMTTLHSLLPLTSLYGFVCQVSQGRRRGKCGVIVCRLRLGLDGAAWAFLASNFTQTALLIIAQAWREVTLHGTPEQTWPGFTSLAFQKWSQFLALGVPAALQVCAEW